MQKELSRISESDNETAGRLLLFGVIAVVGAVFLMISPVLIGGFIIGLIWYGALVSEGEPNGEKLIWPVAITLLLFIYLIGFFPPLDRIYGGVLFRDFNLWTWNEIRSLMISVNSMLPRKFEIHRIYENQVRLYVWSMIPVAGAICTYLGHKGSGRGAIFYQLFHGLFTPLRMFAGRALWIGALLAVTLISALVFTMPHWLVVLLSGSSLLLLIYHYATYGVGQSSKTTDEAKKIAGPIFLGVEKGKSRKIALTEEQLNHHVHIVGASGFGKSVLLSHIIKNRIESKSGLLFVDLKADFETIRQVISTAKAAGRLDDLSIFSCGNPEISSPYNVIARGTANQLKDRIMGALNWSEEFYKNESSSFLLKLLRGLTALRDSGSGDFDLGVILECATHPRKILDLARGLPDSEENVRHELEELAGSLARPEQLRALQGLRSQLESLLLSDFGHLLKEHPSGIDLFEAIQKKKIVYVLLDSRTYGESAKALGKLILQDLKAASAKIDAEIERSKRMPFSVVIDEFSDMASEDFIGFLDRARSSKIGVTVAHQELSDLSRISPEFANRLMNSTSTLFAFLQKLPTSSELISGICGTRKTKEVTEQAKSNWLFGDEKTGMKSIKEVDEFVIHPNTIRSLGVGECVLAQKYPSSKALVMKVKNEVKDYLEEKEVREILRQMKERYGEQMVMKKRQKMEVASDVNQGNYWSKQSNKGENIDVK